MKKLLLIVVSFFCLSNVFGQFSVNRYLDIDELRKTKEYRQKKIDEWNALKVKSEMTYKVTYKHGYVNDSFLASKTTFENEGLQKVQRFYDKKGRERYHSEYVYNKAWELMEFSSWSKNQKNRYRQLNIYNEEGKETEQVNYYKDMNEPSWRYNWIYDEEGKVVEHNYINKKSKLNERWVYEYYPDGKKKEVITYDSKGNLKNVFSYECHEEGQTQKQVEKDTTRYCVRYEDDGHGNQVKIVEQKLAGKKGGRSVSKYNMLGNFLESVNFDEDGKELSRSRYTYSEDGRIVESIYSREGKLYSRNTYQYAGDGQTYKMTARYNEKGLVSASYYEYEYF